MLRIFNLSESEVVSGLVRAEFIILTVSKLTATAVSLLNGALRYYKKHDLFFLTALAGTGVMLFGMNARGTDTLNSREGIRDIFLRLIAASALVLSIMTLALDRLRDLLVGRETLDVAVIIVAACIFIGSISFFKSLESQMLVSRIFFSVGALARGSGNLAMHNIRYCLHRIIGLGSMVDEACSLLTKSVLLLSQLLVFLARKLSESGIVVSVARRSSVSSAMITKFGSNCAGQAVLPSPTVSIKAFGGPLVSGSLTSWSA